MFEYFADVIAGLLGFDGFLMFSLFYLFLGNYRGSILLMVLIVLMGMLIFTAFCCFPFIVNELVALLVVLFFVNALKFLLV